MKLVKQSEFARQLGVTRQAIYDAKKKGLLNIEKKGNKVYVDIEGYKTIAYINNNNSQRSSFLQKKQIKINNEDVKNKSPEEIAKLLKESDIMQLIYQKARAEAKQEEVIKKKLENAYKRGELIDREKVYEYVMFFLDKIIRGMELISNIFLSDIGNSITAAGKVTPKIRQRWNDTVVKHIHNAKNQTIKNIKKIQKEQAK